eukprot:g4314.t1
MQLLQQVMSRVAISEGGRVDKRELVDALRQLATGDISDVEALLGDNGEDGPGGGDGGISIDELIACFAPEEAFGEGVEGVAVAAAAAAAAAGSAAAGAAVVARWLREASAFSSISSQSGLP